MSHNNSWLRKSRFYDGNKNLRLPQNYNNDSHALPTNNDASFQLPPPRKSSVMFSDRKAIQGMPGKLTHGRQQRAPAPQHSMGLQQPRQYGGRTSFGGRPSIGPPQNNRQPRNTVRPPALMMPLPHPQTPLHRSTPRALTRKLLSSIGRDRSVKSSISKKVSFNDLDGVEPLQESIIEETSLASGITAKEKSDIVKVSVGTNTDPVDPSKPLNDGEKQIMTEMMTDMAAFCDKIQTYMKRFEEIKNAVTPTQPSNKVIFMTNLEDIPESTEVSRSISNTDTLSGERTIGGRRRSSGKGRVSISPKIKPFIPARYSPRITKLIEASKLALSQKSPTKINLLGKLSPTVTLNKISQTSPTKLDVNFSEIVSKPSDELTKSPRQSPSNCTSFKIVGQISPMLKYLMQSAEKAVMTLTTENVVSTSPSAEEVLTSPTSIKSPTFIPFEEVQNTTTEVPNIKESLDASSFAVISNSKLPFPLRRSARILANESPLRKSPFARKRKSRF